MDNDEGVILGKKTKRYNEDTIVVDVGVVVVDYSVVDEQSERDKL